MRRRFLLLLLLCTLPVFLFSPLQAQQREEAAEEPINITSDQLEANKSAGTVKFTGNVVVRQKGGVMMSDLLNVYYDSQNRMEKILATGNVRINQADRVGTCQRAIFFPGENKIIMEEEPRLWKDSDMVSGDRITLFLDSDKILVEGARATIFQEKKDSGEGQGDEEKISP